MMEHNNTNSNKRIAKNTFFLYGRMIVVLLVSLYTTRVLLNILGVVDYGVLNVVAGFVSMFAFLNSAMTNTTQRFYNFEKHTSSLDGRKETYNTALQIQIVLALIIFTLLETVGLWYIDNYMVIPPERLTAAKYVFQFSTVSLIFLVLQIPYSAAIIAHECMDYYAVVSICEVFLKLAVVLILPFVSYDKLVFYGMTSLLISVANFLLYFIYSRKNFEEIRIRRRFAGGKFKKMLSFTSWNLFGSFAYMIQGQGLNVMMNAFFGPAVNAARGVAYQIQGALSGFSENIATAFRPQLVGSYAEKNYDRTRTLMFSMSKFCFVMLCALAIPVIVELRYILDVWLDGTIPEYTTIFTFFILSNMLVGGLNMPISQTVQATGKVKYYQLLRSILVTSTLPIAWIVLKLGFSPTSVFVVMLSISILNQPLSMAILHRLFYYDYRTYIKSVLLPCLAFLAFAPILPLLIKQSMPTSFLRLCIVVLSSACSSVIIAYTIVLSPSERQMAKEMVSNIIHKITRK